MKAAGAKEIKASGGKRAQILPICGAPRIKLLNIVIDVSEKIGHFDRGKRRISAFVADFYAGAVDGLIDGIGRYNAVCDGNIRLKRDLGNALCAFGGNVIEMRRFAADKRAQANDGVIFILRSDFLSGHGNFEASGNPEDIDILFISAVPLDRIERAFDKSVGDKIIEARGDDGEFLRRIDEITFVNHVL